ncbi:hypothetical protein [Sphingobacterium sp. BS-2]|uniref:hypothetical protein n=1 Tax=Sphingobacterium sp. BS-2 TaxID=3377129 RepID=UPI0038FC6057
MKAILEQIVADAILHAKWLNTLSFMENAGARKISACEDPLNTDLIQLKHAAEEHRHAYYLKKQIGKLGIEGFEFYNESSLIGGKASVQYLHLLDVKTSRYLKEQFNLTGQELRYAAYLFVTYAIEVRADELYPIYQEVLTSVGSNVMVKSIILEEEGHLEEMISQLKGFDPKWEAHAEHVLQIEAVLFHHWIAEVSKEVALCDVNN